MVIVGDVVVTKIIEKLIDVGFEYLRDLWYTGLKDERQRLKDALPRIQVVVQAADSVWTFQAHVDNVPLQEWLQQLKDALYEADDALDELQYLRLQKQVEEDTSLDEPPQTVRPLFSDFKENITHIWNILAPDPIFERLRSAVKRLVQVADRVGDFHALVKDVQQPQYQQHQFQLIRSRETGSLLTESKVIGRDTEREKLLQWLMKPQPAAEDQDDKSNVSLYSVVGVGGIGKTTLAQLVYNDEDVQKSFDLKMWVCVSTDFDVRRITAAMLESATEKRPELDNLATLQDALKKELMSSNKYLLVLDDVWDDGSCSDWDRLLAPLMRHGHKGSKILLTTRMEKVANEAARAMSDSPKNSLHLKPIDRDEFFSLFERHAFVGATSGDRMQLQPIGRQIAERLGGLPLAAKIIGALLNSNLDEAYWARIRDCKNISDQGQQGVGNINSILMLSYHQLPPYLRPCFAFCGTFPQDYPFRKEDLVLKWMALGLIQQSPRQTPEDIGGFYFDELLNRSFFEKDKYVNCYFMHDLLHDVARSVSNGECFSIEHDDKSVEDIPHTIRHLYLVTNNLDAIVKVDKWQQLRSLQLEIEIENHEVDELKLVKVLEAVFKSLKCVRVLDILVRNMAILPDKFGHLRHLRSLRILSKIVEFPNSLCKLHNLQVLVFLIPNFVALPKNVKNLISLRHLRMTRHGDNCLVIARVGKLVSLQSLNICIKRERNYKIEELKGLNLIRKLHVKGLENVGCPEEASMAKLDKKEQLRVLHLEWSQDDDNEGNDLKMDEQQQILDCLQPHSNLKELTIKEYRGVRPAKWMDFELVNNLQRITLGNCLRLEHLPSFGKLPFLKYLYLEKMPLVKQLHCDYQQLEELCLLRMEGLEEISHSDGNSGQWCPCLQKLSIKFSPVLSVLPSLSLSLKSMKLREVGLTALPELWLGSEDSSSSSSSSSLSSLQIYSCRKLTSLDKGLLQQQHCLAALETLYINRCDMLVDFPAGGFQHLCGLETLAIEHCCSLRLDPILIDRSRSYENFLPSSLQSLSILDCAEVELASLPGGTHASLRRLSIGGMKSLHSCSVLKKLTSLNSLSISDWEELTSLEFMNSLQNLRSLSIKGCPKLVHTAITTATTGITLAVEDLTIDDPMLLLTESFKNLTLLRELQIEDCSNLESISGEMEEWLLQRKATLESLFLWEALSLKYLPDSLQTFSSLRSLWLTDAGNLESLPQLPASLEQLRIDGGSGTLKERCRKDEGADWPNIKHIPHIDIS